MSGNVEHFRKVYKSLPDNLKLEIDMTDKSDYCQCKKHIDKYLKELEEVMDISFQGKENIRVIFNEDEITDIIDAVYFEVLEEMHIESETKSKGIGTNKNIKSISELLQDNYEKNIEELKKDNDIITQIHKELSNRGDIRFKSPRRYNQLDKLAELISSVKPKEFKLIYEMVLNGLGNEENKIEKKTQELIESFEKIKEKLIEEEIDEAIIVKNRIFENAFKYQDLVIIYNSIINNKVNEKRYNEVIDKVVDLCMVVGLPDGIKKEKYCEEYFKLNEVDRNQWIDKMKVINEILLPNIKSIIKTYLKIKCYLLNYKKVCKYKCKEIKNYKLIKIDDMFSEKSYSYHNLIEILNLVIEKYKIGKSIKYKEEYDFSFKKANQDGCVISNFDKDFNVLIGGYLYVNNIELGEYILKAMICLSGNIIEKYNYFGNIGVVGENLDIIEIILESPKIINSKQWLNKNESYSESYLTNIKHILKLFNDWKEFKNRPIRIISNLNNTIKPYSNKDILQNRMKNFKLQSKNYKLIRLIFKSINKILHVSFYNEFDLNEWKDAVFQLDEDEFRKVAKFYNSLHNGKKMIPNKFKEINNLNDEFQYFMNIIEKINLLNTKQDYFFQDTNQKMEYNQELKLNIELKSFISNEELLKFENKCIKCEYYTGKMCCLNFLPKNSCIMAQEMGEVLYINNEFETLDDELRFNESDIFRNIKSELNQEIYEYINQKLYPPSIENGKFSIKTVFNLIFLFSDPNTKYKCNEIEVDEEGNILIKNIEKIG